MGFDGIGSFGLDWRVMCGRLGIVEPPDFKELLDVLEMILEFLVFFGEVFDDLGVLQDHLFDIEDSLLVEGFFQSVSVGTLMSRELSLGLRVERWVGLGWLDV